MGKQSTFQQNQQSIKKSNKTNPQSSSKSNKNQRNNAVISNGTSASFKSKKMNHSKYQNDQKQQNISSNSYDEEQVFNTDLIGSKSDKNQQYETLLNESTKGFKRQKNKYFLENERYKTKGNKQQQGEQEDYQEEDQQMIDQDQIQEEFDQQAEESENFDNQQPQNSESEQNQNQINGALSLLKDKRRQTSKLLNSELNRINKQDEESFAKMKSMKQKSTSQQHEEAIQLKSLIGIYDHLVSLRYNQQKQLQQVKAFPKVSIVDQELKYPPENHELYTKNKQLENQIITNLSNLYSIYQKLGRKCKLTEDDPEQTLEEMIQKDNHESEQNNSPSQKLNVNKIYSYIQQTLSPMNNEVEKQLIKWSQKTSFIGTSSNQSQYNSLLMQTPIGQAKKVLSNWERMAHKSQQKRGTAPFKILFEEVNNIHQTSDQQIYDDYDLFIELEKYYLQKLDNDEDGQFLQSATMKYLKNRQSAQMNKQINKKDVDRKASKNRKIRYQVHPKLLNFMPSMVQNCLDTRDEIVKNMFNCNAERNEQAMEGNAGKYNQSMDEQVDFIDVA